MPVETGHGTFGYIRIFTFNVTDAEGFVDEFARLARQLPQEGLIIDVRGNGGGLIFAAEQLLQVLTPRRIEPQKAQFSTTPVNLQICRNHTGTGAVPGLNLSDWITSIEQAVETGAHFSLGFPISDKERCNSRGQAYYGPAVLITDALCYSATDMFSAGFQDHQIGQILGVSENTGAGGANVWSHALLRSLMSSSDPSAYPSPYQPLPKGADMRVAIRRTTRVGINSGAVVEDLGIKPDDQHRMTRRDLLEGNHDLIEAAGALLAAQAAHPITVSQQPVAGGLPRLAVTTRNITRLDVIFNKRPRGSFDVQADQITIDLPALVGPPPAGPRDLELQAYADDELVAAYRASLA
jgi:hypothetical protein